MAVRANLAGIGHDESLVSPEPAGNCVTWVLGHLLHYLEGLLTALGQSPTLGQEGLARYARGSEPLSDGSGALPLEELLENWQSSTDRLRQVLETLDEEQFSMTRDFTGSGRETTLDGHVAFALFHLAYHAGQLGLLRRLLGREGGIP